MSVRETIPVDANVNAEQVPDQTALSPFYAGDIDFGIASERLEALRNVLDGDPLPLSGPDQDPVIRSSGRELLLASAQQNRDEALVLFMSRAAQSLAEVDDGQLAETAETLLDTRLSHLEKEAFQTDRLVDHIVETVHFYRVFRQESAALYSEVMDRVKEDPEARYKLLKMFARVSLDDNNTVIDDEKLVAFSVVAEEGESGIDYLQEYLRVEMRTGVYDDFIAKDIVNSLDPEKTITDSDLERFQQQLRFLAYFMPEITDAERVTYFLNARHAWPEGLREAADHIKSALLARFVKVANRVGEELNGTLTSFSNDKEADLTKATQKLINASRMLARRTAQANGTVSKKSPPKQATKPEVGYQLVLHPDYDPGRKIPITAAIQRYDEKTRGTFFEDQPDSTGALEGIKRAYLKAENRQHDRALDIVLDRAFKHLQSFDFSQPITPSMGMRPLEDVRIRMDGPQGQYTRVFEQKLISIQGAREGARQLEKIRILFVIRGGFDLKRISVVGICDRDKLPEFIKNVLHSGATGDSKPRFRKH